MPPPNVELGPASLQNVVQNVIQNVSNMVGVPGKLREVRVHKEIWESGETWFWAREDQEKLLTVAEEEGEELWKFGDFVSG